MAKNYIPNLTNPLNRRLVNDFKIPMFPLGNPPAVRAFSVTEMKTLYVAIKAK